MFYLLFVLFGKLVYWVFYRFLVCIVYFVLINDRVLSIVVFVFRVLVVKFEVKLVFWFILIELFNFVLLGVFKE